MKAIVFDSKKKDFFLMDVPIPEVKENEVLIRIKACGVCGSDIHLWEGIIKPKKDLIIPGHEASGIIEKTGDKVLHLKKGDKVVISAGTSCGKCKFCISKKENLCDDVGVLGFERDGAFCEFISVPASNVFLLPDGIPFEEAAILADAVSTPYQALRFVGDLKKDQNVLILGCGGLGIHAIKIAKILKANKIYAMDKDPLALENAKKVGATEIFLMENPKQVIRKIQDSFSLILDFTGIYDFIEPFLRLLESGGKYILVGIGKRELNIKIPAVITYRSIQICGSYGSSSQALIDLIELYQNKQLFLKDSISGIFPLEEFQTILHKLKNRIGNPIRFIVNPGL